MFLQTGSEEGRKEGALNCFSSTSPECHLRLKKVILVTIKSISVVITVGTKFPLSLPCGNLNRSQRCQMKQAEGECITEVTVAVVSQ